MFLPALPNVKAGGKAKALVLNQRNVLLLLTELGSPTRFGNSVARPATGPIFRLSEERNTVYGRPLSKDEIAASDQFAQCQVTKVFQAVCFRAPTSTADLQTVAAIKASFKSGYNLKQVFQQSAAACPGQ